MEYKVPISQSPQKVRSQFPQDPIPLAAIGIELNNTLPTTNAPIPPPSTTSSVVHSLRMSSLGYTSGVATSGGAGNVGGTISIVGSILGLIVAVTAVGCILGTVIHWEHHDDYVRNTFLAGVSILVSAYLLTPVFKAHLKVPGYAIPFELQDML